MGLKVIELARNDKANSKFEERWVIFDNGKKYWVFDNGKKYWVLSEYAYSKREEVLSMGEKEWKIRTIQEREKIRMIAKEQTIARAKWINELMAKKMENQFALLVCTICGMEVNATIGTRTEGTDQPYEVRDLECNNILCEHYYWKMNESLNIHEVEIITFDFAEQEEKYLSEVKLKNKIKKIIKERDLFKEIRKKQGKRIKKCSLCNAIINIGEKYYQNRDIVCLNCWKTEIGE